MSQLSVSWTPQEMMKAKKIVVEIYNKNKKSGGSGFILDILNHRAYILTTAQWLKNYPPPLLVNVFYQGDYPAKLLYQDTRLALLSVEGIHAKAFYSLSHESLKSNEPMMTIGFPKDQLPWTHQPLVYIKNKGDLLLFSGHLTEGYYGGPLIKGDKIVGIITGHETEMIQAYSVETINNFLKSSVPEAKELLARNAQRLSLIVKAQTMNQITQKSTQPLKARTNTDLLQNKTAITSLSLEKTPPHSPISVSPLRTVFLSSLSRHFSPSLTFMHRSKSPTLRDPQTLRLTQKVQPSLPRESQTLHLTLGTQALTSRDVRTIHRTPPESLPKATDPRHFLQSSNFNHRKTIKQSPHQPLESPPIPRLSKKTEPFFPVQPGADAFVLIDAMCSALETNDTDTFIQIARLLHKNHPLLYLARNLETALTIHDRKAILQHSIKFLFEAFLLSIRSNTHSSCSQKLIKQKNRELEQINKTSSQSPSNFK